MSWFGGSGSDSATSSFSKYDDNSSSSFGSSSFDTGSSFDSGSGLGGGGGADAELQKFIMMQSQQAQLRESIHKLNDTCWDTCTVSADSKLGSRTETCLSNCVERFIDASVFMTNRFAQLLQKNAGGMS